MICQQPLTTEQRHRSQFNYNMFNVINGFSYMCLGETVLILLAVQLDCPDYFVSTLGAMLYFGFLLLPLGKLFTAQVGAAQTQTIFWILRNCAALLVGSSTIFHAMGWHLFSMGTLLLGAFLFYGFRAAGVVMSQPLIGDFTDEISRPRVIAVSIGLFYVSCFFALITISWLLHLNSSVWMLTGVIVVGAMFGFSSSHFIRKIDETESIRQSARKPIRAELVSALRDRSLKRQILAGFIINLAIIMLVPVSMLTLKRGYRVSDTDALLYALVQFAAAAIVSFLSGKVAAKIGPRKTMLHAYGLLLLLGLLWVFAPAEKSFTYLALPFFLAGGASVALNNSVMHYFLQNVPPSKRVAASIFVSVVTGAGAGVVGMLLAGLLLRVFVPGESGGSLLNYQHYFLCATLLLLPGILAILRLTPLPQEKRKIKKSWNEVN